MTINGGDQGATQDAQRHDPAQEDWFANFNDLSVELPTKGKKSALPPGKRPQQHAAETTSISDRSAREQFEHNGSLNERAETARGTRPADRGQNRDEAVKGRDRKLQASTRGIERERQEERYGGGSNENDVAYLDLRKALNAKGPRQKVPVRKFVSREWDGPGAFDDATADGATRQTDAEWLRMNNGETTEHRFFESAVGSLQQEIERKRESDIDEGFENVVARLQAEIAAQSDAANPVIKAGRKTPSHSSDPQSTAGSGLAPGLYSEPEPNTTNKPLDALFSRLTEPSSPSSQTENSETHAKNTSDAGHNEESPSIQNLRNKPQDQAVPPLANRLSPPIFTANDRKPRYRPESSYQRRGSIAEDVEARNNKPAWGGLTEKGPVLTDNVTLSYDSLRNADKVSPHPEVLTKVNSRPWGLKAVEKPDQDFALSPAELAERHSVEGIKEESQPASTQMESPKDEEKGSWLKRSFQSFKRGLFGANEETEKTNTSPTSTFSATGVKPKNNYVTSSTSGADAQQSTAEQLGSYRVADPRVEHRVADDLSTSPQSLASDADQGANLPAQHNLANSAQVEDAYPSKRLADLYRATSRDTEPDSREREVNVTKTHHDPRIRKIVRQPSADLPSEQPSGRETSRTREVGDDNRDVFSRPIAKQVASPGVLQRARRAKKQAYAQAKKEGQTLVQRKKVSKNAFLRALDGSLESLDEEGRNERKETGDERQSESAVEEKTERQGENAEPSLEQVMAKASTEQSEPTASDQENDEATNDGIQGITETDNRDFQSQLFTVDASSLHVEPLDIDQPPVPALSYGLDRVLFNPGVYQLQDPHSKVYNFDPYLQKIMPVVEFDFNALKEYKSSSQDTLLSDLAHQHKKKYVGSTSSMTATLAHFHFLLSDWRDVNTSMLSQGFPVGQSSSKFTTINRAPNAIFLRFKKDSGTYAIDADKQYDSGNVLMMLGKSMEKLLTMSPDEYERYRKSDPRTVSEEERNAPEAFQFTTMGDFLMRSQLDAHDPRLPGTGMFDLKTRAVVTVRMDATDFEPMLGYEIQTMQGKFQSYEREYYDMIRSTMLKYMLQVRMGRMDGIFVAYHNVERIFGFQYISVAEMDRALHGQIDPCLGDQEFRTSLRLLNEVLERATNRFPEKSLRVQFETRENPTAMYVFAEPMEEDEIDTLQTAPKERIAQFEKDMMGLNREEREPPKSEEGSAAEADQSDKSSEQQATDSAPSETSTLTSGPTTHLSESASKPTDSTDSFADSTSSADPSYMSELTDSTSTSTKPLYAATLMTRSRINGPYADIRTSHLSPTDTWEIETLIREIPEPKDAWALYEASKARRKVAFDREREEELDEAGVPTGQRKVDGYIQGMRRMAKEGREFRGKLDEVERVQGKRRVVVGVPQEVVKFGGEGVVKGEAGGDVEEAVVEGVVAEEADSTVEGYMDWLYKGSREQTRGVVEEAVVKEANPTVEEYMDWLYRKQ